MAVLVREEVASQPYRRKTWTRFGISVLVQDAIVIGTYVQPATKVERRKELLALVHELRRDRPQHELIVAGDLNNPDESVHEL